jgi:hypothetical protein
LSVEVVAEEVADAAGVAKVAAEDVEEDVDARRTLPTRITRRSISRTEVTLHKNGRLYHGHNNNKS